MRYSIEPRIYVKGYECSSFEKKNFGKNATKVGKSMSNKYSQKLLGSVKESTTDTTKTDSKREIRKTAEATCDLSGNKIADKITSISKSPNELHLVESRSKTDENEIKTPKERYISSEKRQQIIDGLRPA